MSVREEQEGEGEGEGEEENQEEVLIDNNNGQNENIGDFEEMQNLFKSEKFDLVIDATHPYAVIVTDNIRRAAEAEGVERLRLLRQQQ